MGVSIHVHHPGFRLLLLACLLGCAISTPAAAQITAVARAGATPPWSKGIAPISQESYYHAMSCGKQGGADPACVFWDTDLCKNDDFALAFFTPYKMVAYQVWSAVSRKRPAPTPNYTEAQRTRVTIGVSPVRGSKNAFSELLLKRAGQPVAHATRSLDNGGGQYTYDFPAFKPTAVLTLEIVGKSKTVTCTIPRAVLAQFR